MACQPMLPAAYAGMTAPQLAAALAAAQKALLQLRTGGKPVTVSYAQADGSRTVTYEKADIGTLMNTVNELAGLVYPGQGYGRRRPMRPVYL